MSAPVLRSKQGRDRPVASSTLQRILSRLQDSRDYEMHLVVITLTLLFDVALTAAIIARVPYTEIDWQAYMEEVEGFLGGELDYKNLRGGTGPLVYPAGFVYLFAGIRWLTNGAIFPAQVLFAGVYIATQALVMVLYAKSEAVPPFLHVSLALSKRMHSIYVLRLFNDCWTMLFAYGALYLLMSRRVAASIAAFSVAVSTKMNVLLFAPGVLAVCLLGARLQDVAVGVATGVALQVALAVPFLAVAPGSYFSRAFEFSRAFFYKWTVNWRMVPEATFLSPQFAVLLLGMHLTLLAVFAHFRWTGGTGGLLQALWRFLTGNSVSSNPQDGPEGSNMGVKTDLKETVDISSSASLQHTSVRPRTRSVTAKSESQNEQISSRKRSEGSKAPTVALDVRGGTGPQVVAADATSSRELLSNGDLVEIVMCSNLVGILCARSLHYQFYCWYFHSIPFLLWRTELPVMARGIILIAIEWCWNVFPSTNTSSSLLLAAHVLIVGALWLSRTFRIGSKAQ